MPGPETLTLPPAAANTAPVPGAPGLTPPRTEFMPKPATRNLQPIPLAPATAENSISAQITRDAQDNRRRNMVGLTWQADGATFLVSGHSYESRFEDKFDVDKGKFNRGTAKAEDALRGTKLFTGKIPGLGISITKIPAFRNENNGLKLSGFEWHHSRHGGPAFDGTATVNTTWKPMIQRRTVDVIRDGHVTKVLDFESDEAFRAYIDNNSKPGEDSLHFDQFAWEDRKPPVSNVKDKIPVPTEKGQPISLTEVDQQRRRLGLNDFTGLTWKDARGQKSQVVKAYTVMTKPNVYSQVEVREERVEVQTEHVDSRGKVFKRSLIYSVDGLQKHFDGMAKKKSAAETEPHWELDQLPTSDLNGRVLRKEELNSLEFGGAVPPRYAETIGRFATKLVVKSPERKAGDPGLSRDEAIELLAEPDRPGWEDRVEEAKTGKGAKYRIFRANASNLERTVNEMGSAVVGGTADYMLKELQSELNRLGMHEEADNASISWAYSVLAQMHMHTKRYPDSEGADGIVLGDPLEMSQTGQLVRQQLIDMKVASTFAEAATEPIERTGRNADGELVRVMEHAVQPMAIMQLPETIRNRVHMMIQRYQPLQGKPLSLAALSALGEELRIGFYDTETVEKNRRRKRDNEVKHRI